MIWQELHSGFIKSLFCLCETECFQCNSYSRSNNMTFIHWSFAIFICNSLSFSTKRKPLPRATPNAPWLHCPVYLWPWRWAPANPHSYHVHVDPHRPPTAGLHNSFATLAHGHTVTRFPQGPPTASTHTLTSWGPRGRGGRGGWVQVFQSSGSEEGKASGTAHSRESQTMTVCVQRLTGRAPLSLRQVKVIY